MRFGRVKKQELDNMINTMNGYSYIHGKFFTYNRWCGIHQILYNTDVKTSGKSKLMDDESLLKLMEKCDVFITTMKIIDERKCKHEQ